MVLKAALTKYFTQSDKVKIEKQKISTTDNRAKDKKGGEFWNYFVWSE